VKVRRRSSGKVRSEIIGGTRGVSVKGEPVASARSRRRLAQLIEPP
jgi:hypothetical protein